MLVPGSKNKIVLGPAAVMAVLCSLLLVPGAAAQKWRVVEDDDWCDKSRGSRICEVREITLPANRDVIDVACTNGSITVEGWNRDEIYIKAKIEVRGKTKQDARDLLEEIEIRTDREIKAEGPKNGWFSFFWGRKWSVSYQLKVPEQSNLYAHTTNGRVEIADVAGEIECSTTNGGMKLNKVNGNVNCGTVNGGISVSLEGDTWDGRGLRLSTTNGGVRINMPSDYSVRLEAKTTNGGIHVEHAARVERQSRRRLSATIGGGGPLIRVRTVNGGVKIRESD